MAHDQGQRCAELMTYVCKEHQFLLVQLLVLLFLITFPFKRKGQLSLYLLVPDIVREQRKYDKGIQAPSPPRIVPRLTDRDIERNLGIRVQVVVQGIYLQHITARLEVRIVQFRLVSNQPILVEAVKHVPIGFLGDMLTEIG